MCGVNSTVRARGEFASQAHTLRPYTVAVCPARLVGPAPRIRTEEPSSSELGFAIANDEHRSSPSDLLSDLVKIGRAVKASSLAVSFASVSLLEWASSSGVV